MEKELQFLNNYYARAIRLSDDFGITRIREWSPMVILNELSVQVGHVYNIVYKSEAVDEPNRAFNDLGDELSDVFLQLIALASSMGMNLYEVRSLQELKEDNWLALPVVLGQLNEAVMERYGYRFNKPRSGFATTDEFISNRICRLFDITYQIAVKYNLDIEQEFARMLDDANAFLERYRQKHGYSRKLVKEG